MIFRVMQVPYRSLKILFTAILFETLSLLVHLLYKPPGRIKLIGLKKFRYDNIFVAFARIIIFYKTLKLSGGVRAPRISA